MSGGRDPRIDAYIAKAQPFAQAILTHLRDLMHRQVPGAEEAIKWGMPFFTLNGSPLANMGAFKAHAAFGFWRHAEVTGTPEREGAMGSLGKLTALGDLPSDEELAAMIAKAVALVGEGKPKRPAAKPKAALDLPADLGAALKANAAAQAHWDAFRPVSGATISNGCSRRSERKRASGGSKRSWRRWPRARTGTGSIRGADYSVAPAKAGAAIGLRSGEGKGRQRPPPSRGRRIVIRSRRLRNISAD